MPKLEVTRVAMDWSGQTPVVILKEADGPRQLAIWVGHAEARAVLVALEGHVAPRPLTHDLFVETLSALGHGRMEGRITDFDAGVFGGELDIDGVVVPARPSDLIALSVRNGMPLHCEEQVLAEAGFQETSGTEDDVERFRAFLDHVTPDDFEG